MKTWKIEIEMKVNETWIEDGFDAGQRIGEIEELISNLLPYAYEYEFQVKAKIKSAPDKQVILNLQGY